MTVNLRERLMLGRRQSIGLLSAAAVSALLMLTWASGSSSHVDAHSPHADLDFSIGVAGLGCNTSGGGATCNVAMGANFSVSVYLNTLPSGVPDYEAFDLFVTYSGVTSQNNASVAWPGCGFQASHYAAGEVRWGCSIGTGGSPSTYTGVIGANTFTCTPGASSGHTITLRHGAASGDTRLIEQLGAIHAQGELTTEHLTVNCINPGAFVVDAIGDVASPGDPVNTVRNVSVGTPFYVTVHASAPPVVGTTGYRAYQAELRWDEPLLNYLPTGSAADEDYWQENAPTSCTVAPRIIKPDNDVGTDAAVSNACVATASNAYTGPVVQLQFVCQGPASSTAQLSLVSSVSDPPYGTRFVAANGAQTLPVLANATVNCVAIDTDSDGMPDWWEALYSCTNAGVPDAGDDDDLDGATHLQEFNGGSDPCDSDTDGDGLNDGAELLTYFTDPNSADSDGDALSDFDEINTHSTDPSDFDSDGDGLNDGFELDIGTNPNNPDSDSDTFNDYQERVLGSNPTLGSSTPEHLTVTGSCSDSTDNDGDILVDANDPGCAPVLIDPSGDVYEIDTLALIQGATVRLFRINPVTLDPQEMDPIVHAGMFAPELNPETTDSNGRYAWDVAAGDYFVRVSKPGCSTEDSTVETIPPPVTDLDVGLDCPDTDGDGLKDHKEIELGTSYIDRDHDNDGCTEGQELGPNELDGGDRDPLDPHDYFNPSQDGLNRVDDILLVVQAYFDDDNDGNPGLPPYVAGYNPITDRSNMAPSPNPWNTGAPDGLQRVQDILHSVNSYFHDCA